MNKSVIMIRLEEAEELIGQLDKQDQIEFYISLCEKYADRIMNLKGFEKINNKDKRN